MESQVKSLYRPLYLYIRNRISNKEDAEDLTQEVFFKLSRSNTENIKDLKSWIYTIAKNTITDFYRKKKVHTEAFEDKAIFDDSSNEVAVRELSKCVRHFINELPDKYRVTLVLSDLEDIPQKEIAARLNINYTTLRSRVQRGRKKLRELFSDCCTIEQGGKGSILGFTNGNSSAINEDSAGVCCSDNDRP